MTFRKIGILLPFLFFSLAVHSQNISEDTFGKGLSATAKDSSFHVKFGFRFQTLYAGVQNVATNQYSEKMMIRRSRLKFEGFAYDPRVTYKLELGLSNRDHSSGQIPESGNTANVILDAVVKYEFAENWSVWFGQTKLPGNRERVISSQKLQFVDRSLVNSRFNLDRGSGIQLHHKIGTNFVFKQALAITMGEGRDITSSNPSNGHELTGRLELLPFGEFTGKGDYFGSDLKREASPKLSLGITGDYNYDAARERGNLGDFKTDQAGDYILTDMRTYIMDLMFKYNGWSLASEYASRSASVEKQQFGTGRGIVVQVGYLLPSNWELAGRVTDIHAFKNSTLNDVSEYTFGISRYVVGHNLKIQSDFSYQNIAGDDNEMIFRFQTELAF